MPGFLEVPLALPVCGEAILLEAIDGIVEDRDHQALLRAVLGTRPEVLFGQEDIELRQVDGVLLG
jgi:hypothetical protein